MAVRTAEATGLGARAKRFVDDGLDGAGAAAAFRAATEAAVDLLRMTRQIAGGTHGIANIMVAEDVAGTDDHEVGGPIGDANVLQILKRRAGCKRKNRSFKQFQTDAEYSLE